MSIFPANGVPAAGSGAGWCWVLGCVPEPGLSLLLQANAADAAFGGGSAIAGGGRVGAGDGGGATTCGERHGGGDESQERSRALSGGR
jgi:hypothetical protein